MDPQAAYDELMEFADRPGASLYRLHRQPQLQALLAWIQRGGFPPVLRETTNWVGRKVNYLVKLHLEEQSQ